MELVWLAYSPWSQKARWALEHHGVQFERTTFRPMIDEPRLRLRLKKLRGAVSVPVLFEGDKALTDSFEIAQRAEALGGGAPLFADLEAAHHWNAVSERALQGGRERTIQAVLQDPEAQAESLKGIVPDALTGPLRGIAKLGARQLRRKYGEGQVVELEAGLEQLRATLDGRDYLLDEFSYADIAMAVVFEFVEPSAHVRRGVAERRAWSDARLAARYADLVEWRDQLWARHGWKK